MNDGPLLSQRLDRTIRSIAELPGPGGLPLLGNALQITPSRFHLQLEEWARQYGKRYRLAIGARRFMVTADHQDISRILKDRPEGWRRSDRVEMIAREAGLAGLFSVNGEEWRRQRPLVMAAFNPGHVRAYFPSLHTAASRFLNRWQGHARAGTVFELEPELMRFTVDVTAGLAFGTDINTIESDGDIIQDHLKDIFRMLQKRYLSPFPYWHWIRFPEDRKLAHDIDTVKQAVHGFIHAARARMERQSELREHPRNLLEAMIAARDENGRPFSDEELTGNVFTLLLAGEDTTAHTMAWLIHLLHAHPSAMQTLRSEVDKVLGADRLPVCQAQLGALDYTAACLMETMRLKPVGPIIAGEANQDTIVGDVAIPKGTMVMMLMRFESLQENRFTDPLAFVPQRWIGDGTPENHRRVSMPFGAGPRMCPGRYLALEEMKMLTAMLVRNFHITDLSTSDGGPVKEDLRFTLMPAGLRIRLQARSSGE